MNQSVTLTTPDFVKNPYPFYDEIRSIQPIYKGNFFKYPGWYVTGYEEASLILKDIRFQNRVPIPETTKKYENLKNVQNKMMLYQNPPDHTRLRAFVRERFTFRALEQYRPIIEEIALVLLQKVKDQKKMNVISEFSFPLASLVIAKMLGVPEEDKDLFREWALTLIKTIDLTRSRQSLVKGNDTIMAMRTYFKELIAKRSQHPKEDMISLLVAEGQNGDKLTEEELLSTCILLVIAGHETTVNLISNSVYCLLTNPTEFHKLIENPSLIESTIEECLRYESSTQMTARIASENVSLNQTEIKKGDHVYVFMGAANRDPKQFANANVFDITRNPNPHLSFGAGIHFCLGAILSRMEAQIAIQTLLQNTVNLRLDTDDVQWRNLTGFRALEELPISFS
ncbi:cytochrome P450 [Alkalihalobacillus deserti]|uniref:cytochrome P450 n=1 Tax=Alkalihalobacillus deserti TaxID=2879466 RepID=UPI001D13A96A|nr:cytochrome P450 [Alkalihalobacillus deserti]